MSYFGVSNPELNSPFYGIGAAKRGRARAQRKRFTHTQMAGRNGGFADPREIMAYHNKGELSDGATIQALSLFGIGAAGARKMISDSHRSRQHAAMMGMRMQRASAARMMFGVVPNLTLPGQGGGSSTGVSYKVYDDSRGGSWRVEYSLVSSTGGTLRYSYLIKSLDTTFSLGPFTIIGGPEALQQLEETAKVRIENYVATLPIDEDDDEIIVDNGSDAYEGGDTNGDGGDATGNGNGTTYTPIDISNLNFADVYAVKNAFLAGSITYAQAFMYIQTHFAAILYSQNDIDDFLLVERNYSYTHPGFPKEEHDFLNTNSRHSFPTKYREATPSSTWSIITIKRGENQFSWAATSSNFPEGALSSRTSNFATSEIARRKAMEFIDASVKNFHSSKPLLSYSMLQQDDTGNGGTGENGTGTGENGTGTGENGTGTGENGTGTGTGVTVAEGYDNDTDVIDGYKLGVIGYREAFNTLVLQFAYSENDATEALSTEDTDAEHQAEAYALFHEASAQSAQSVQEQTQEVVPASSGPSFIEENKVALAGGAILVAGAAAMAYSNRRN